MRCFEAPDELRGHVRAILCRRADVDPKTPMHEARLFVGQESAGVEFTLLGPRALRLSAIYDLRRGRIHYYDQSLERFASENVQGPHADEFNDELAPAYRSAWRGK